MPNEYLQWMTSQTKSAYWHDSAILAEAEEAIRNGAVGMTTNPFLVNASVRADPATWKPVLSGIPATLKGQQKAEEIMRRVLVFLAERVKPSFDASGGKNGYVCAQVNPNKPCDDELMLEQARRFAKWAPNICVKLPCTAAGLRVFEICAAEGIGVVCTVSFTVPQCLAIGAAYERARERAKKNGVKPGIGVAVLMTGRLDDYLRDVAKDNQLNVSESDITQAGLAAIKRAYRMFGEKGYHATIMPAAGRGLYHVTELAGADMAMSIAPKWAKLLEETKPPLKEGINNEIAPDVIKRLSVMPEFVKAYEPDGMVPGEFITFGSTNRTLTQFIESGWNQMEAFTLP